MCAHTHPMLRRYYTRPNPLELYDATATAHSLDLQNRSTKWLLCNEQWAFGCGSLRVVRTADRVLSQCLLCLQALNVPPPSLLPKFKNAHTRSLLFSTSFQEKKTSQISICGWFAFVWSDGAHACKRWYNSNRPESSWAQKVCGDVSSIETHCSALALSILFMCESERDRDG